MRHEFIDSRRKSSPCFAAQIYVRGVGPPIQSVRAQTWAGVGPPQPIPAQTWAGWAHPSQPVPAQTWAGWAHPASKSRRRCARGGPTQPVPVQMWAGVT
jgi:hypothetical protein